MKRPHVLRSIQRGVATVEAALLLMPLIVMLIGIAEFGRAFFQYNTIAKAARDAVRYLSMVEPGTGHDAARCLAVTGTSTCSNPPLLDGLSVDNVAICDASACPATHQFVPAVGNGGAATGVMNLVTVTVSGYNSVNFLPLFGEWIQFDAIAATMRQQL